jgi:hypothetical protein
VAAGGIPFTARTLWPPTRYTAASTSARSPGMCRLRSITEHGKRPRAAIESAAESTEAPPPSASTFQTSKTLGVHMAIPYSSVAGDRLPGSKLLSARSIAAIRAGVTSGRAQPWAASTIIDR